MSTSRADQVILDIVREKNKKYRKKKQKRWNKLAI